MDTAPTGHLHLRDTPQLSPLGPSPGDPGLCGVTHSPVGVLGSLGTP